MFVRSMLPLELSVKLAEDDRITTTGKFENLTVEILSNQPIRSVEYMVSPAEPEDGSDYMEAICEGSIFEKNMEIKELKLPPGKSSLWIDVVTWLGETETCEIELESQIGYTSAPEENALIEVENGTYLISNELLLFPAPSASRKEIEELLEKYDGEIVGEIYFMNQYQVRFSEKDKDVLDEIKGKLEQEPLVEEVYYNLSLEAQPDLLPNDTKYDSWDVSEPGGNNWSLECIDAPGAWEYQDEMETVKVGVIDSFLDYEHPDLEIDPSRTSILPTDDFATLESLKEYYDRYADSHQCKGDPAGCVFCSQKDHGTHCAGILGALSNNGRGISGVNWNTEIYFTTWWYYTIPEEGQLSSWSTVNGWMYDIVYMAMSGCRVISVSVSSSQPSQPNNYEESTAKFYDRSIQRLEEAGYDFIIAKSAGNANDDFYNYALNRIMTGGDHSDAHTIVVGAMENRSSLVNRLASWIGGYNRIYNYASYSNYGSGVDIAAPGTDIYSTVYGNEYSNMSGTSMATPIVAGTASLLYSIEDNLTYDLVKSILCGTGVGYCAKGTNAYSIINAREAVEWVRENATQIPEKETPRLGFVTGLVQDAATGEMIENAAVRVTNEATGAVAEAYVDQGTYYLTMPLGQYTMEFSAADYLPETIYHVEITEGIVTYNVLLNLVPDEPSQGIAEGKIINAFDASAIPMASLTVYKGINQTSGQPVTSVISNERGEYNLSLEPGNYTILATAQGYISSAAGIVVISGEKRENQNCTLTPVLNPGEARIVLTWGQFPSDLDSHLVGPSPDGDQFHIYYSNKNHYYQNDLYNNLDVDDTSSYGPETTSIYTGLNGTYTYYVHNYSDRNSSTSSTLSTSGAQVKLYMAGWNEPLVYYVPSQPGTVWEVFSIENGVIRPTNSMSFVSSPGEVGQ